MGHPDGAHIHGSGDGGGLGTAVVVILAVALLGPAVAAAVAELLRLLVIVAAVLLGVGAAGLAGLLMFRARRRLGGAARARSPLPWTVVSLPRLARAAQPPSRPVQRGSEPRQAIGQPGGLHLHLHLGGLSAAERAEVMRQLRGGQ